MWRCFSSWLLCGLSARGVYVRRGRCAFSNLCLSLSLCVQSSIAIVVCLALYLPHAAYYITGIRDCKLPMPRSVVGIACMILTRGFCRSAGLQPAAERPHPVPLGAFASLQASSSTSYVHQTYGHMQPLYQAARGSRSGSTHAKACQFGFYTPQRSQVRRGVGGSQRFRE